MTSWSRLHLIVGAALLLAGCQVTEDQLESFIHQSGYVVLQPPSTLYGPGSLVNRENYDPADTHPTKVMLHYLCNPEFSTTLYGHPPIPGSTLGQHTVTSFSGGLSAALPVLSRLIDLNAKLKGATTITANITDSHILTYGNDDLGAIIDLLGPRCRDSVNTGIRKQNAFQVTEVLQATVDVTVAINADASATAQAQVIKQLGSLGVTLSADRTATIQGTALFFGVKLEPLQTPVTAPKSPAIATSSVVPTGTKVASKRSPRVSTTENTWETWAAAH